MTRYRVEEGLVKEKVIPISVRISSTEDLNATAPIVPINTVIEAENGRLSSAVDVRSNLPDAHDSYVIFGTKSYRFELLEDSRIHIDILAIAPNSNSDSTNLRVDTQKMETWHIQNSKSWQWKTSEISWDLKKGSHTLYLEYREPIYLDQIRIVAIPCCNT
jgi:hypothetical protein